MGTDAGKFRMYYQLIGGYFVQFDSKDAPVGIPYLPTYVQSIEDVLRDATSSLNLETLDPQFVARVESNGTRFHVYTPTRTLNMYADSLEEQKSWMSAIAHVIRENFSNEELSLKNMAAMRLGPLILRQEFTEFTRLKSIFAHMASAGMLEVPQVLLYKKGFLLFQRPEFEDEQFYAALLPDSKPKESEWTKMFCMLRSDKTLTYAKSEKEANVHPEGVISLAHLQVELNRQQIEESGKMIFSLVTPMRTFVICAPHQVALEEWLRSIVKLTTGMEGEGNANAILHELSSLNMKNPVETDLHSILNCDLGIAAYEKFLSKYARNVKVLEVFKCWKLTKEYEEIDKFDCNSAQHQGQRQLLIASIADGYLRDKSILPASICIDLRDEALRSICHSNAPMLLDLQAACFKYLCDVTHEDFLESQSYHRLVTQLTDAEEETRKSVIHGARRVILHAPRDPKIFKRRMKQSRGDPDKLTDISINVEGKEEFEAWTIFDLPENMTTEFTIGREQKSDIAIKDDETVSAHHARIDCEPDGGCFFVDLCSSQGSKVNGICVSGSVRLRVGDVIQVGKTKLLFTIIPEGEDEPIR